MDALTIRLGSNFMVKATLEEGVNVVKELELQWLVFLEFGKWGFENDHRSSHLKWF